MWLIDRQSSGVQTARIPLPDPLRSALVRWYTGCGARADEEAGITLVQQARIGAKWLACDCLGSVATPPILTPAFLSEAETYYLRRLTGPNRTEHRPECPFFRDQATNRLTEVRGPATATDPPTGNFEVLRPAPEKLAQRPDDAGSDDRTRNGSVPRLAGLLFRLIHISGLNLTAPYAQETAERSISHEFRVLSAAASRIEIAPGIELGRAFWTHSSAFHSRRAYAGLRKLAHIWPRGHATQGFLLLFSHQFRGSTLFPADARPITVANRIQSPSVRTNPIKGPYLILVVIGQYPEARGYAPLRAYAQPIVSGNRFVPIETEFERATFRALLDARRELDRRGLDIAIERPTFDRLTQLGPCRPDFILESRSRVTGEIRQIIIEANGVARHLDLASKEAARRKMELIAPVVPVTPLDLTAGQLTARLADVLAS
jgi:hypothetical protein